MHARLSTCYMLSAFLRDAFLSRIVLRIRVISAVFPGKFEDSEVEESVLMWLCFLSFNVSLSVPEDDSQSGGGTSSFSSSSSWRIGRGCFPG